MNQYEKMLQEKYVGRVYETDLFFTVTIIEPPFIYVFRALDPTTLDTVARWSAERTELVGARTNKEVVKGGVFEFKISDRATIFST